MVFTRVERAAQEGLQSVSELHRMGGPLMQFVATSVAPGFDKGEVIGPVVLLIHRIGNKTGIKLCGQRLRARSRAADSSGPGLKALGIMSTWLTIVTLAPAA